MSVDASGLEAALRALALRKAAELGDAFVERAQAEAPKRTGALAASISADEPVDDGTAVRVHVSVASPHAVFVDRGRGPVRAKPGSALVLADGVIVDRVDPAPADPFFERTVDAWGEIVSEVSG